MQELEKILQIANNEVGYLEKSSNSNLDDKTANAGDKNYTKYARDMDVLNVYNGKKQGYAWCNVFIDWCFVQAVGVDRARELLIGFSAGCTQDYNWFKAKGQIVTEPQKGDLVFFGKTSHIGIIEDVREGKIYTIEGNTSNAAELIVNGGTVTRKSYAINSQYIHSFARPNYDANDTNVGSIEQTSTSNEITYSTIKKGSKGNLVRIAQEKLIVKGYKLPKFGIDGDFGSETEEVVKQFQRHNGLADDGIIGPKTWTKLNDSNTKCPQNIYPGYIIEKNQISEDVRKVQARLIELGYSCGKKGADGIFGNNTYNATVSFQKANGLAKDGQVGPLTWNKLFN